MTRDVRGTVLGLGYKMQTINSCGINNTGLIWPEVNMSQFPLSPRSRNIKTLDVVCRVVVYVKKERDRRLIGQALHCIKLMRRVIITVLQQ